MTKRTNNTIEGDTSENFQKLSIQVSLNGLSFCVLDTISNTIVLSDSINFDKQLSPVEVLKRLEKRIEKSGINKKQFTEVVVIHNNSYFCLVPKALFNVKELPNYLKFNIRLLTNDHIAYDEIKSHEMVNVYVPFMNINNYLFDLYGEFEFQHIGTVMVHSLLNARHDKDYPICYVYITDREMDITVISHKKLLLYNRYAFNTKEDFIYYLLFTYEQLDFDTESVPLKLFGRIEEDDEIYALCYKYIKDISIFILSGSAYPLSDLKDETIDFTMLSTL